MSTSGRNLHTDYLPNRAGDAARVQDKAARYRRALEDIRGIASNPAANPKAYVTDFDVIVNIARKALAEDAES